MVTAPLPSDPPAFPKARHGYLRGAVDQYVAELRQRLSSLTAERANLTAENARLAAAVSDLQAKYDRLRTAELDERAQDILGAAEQQAAGLVAAGERAAADILRQADRDAQVITERARQEAAWSKRRLRAEQADLAAQQLALREQLSSLRDLAVDTASQSPAIPELSYADVAHQEPDDPKSENASEEQHA